MRQLAILFATMLLAGCLGPTPPPATEPRTIRGPHEDVVVVAYVDSGINPYHAAFRRAPGQSLGEAELNRLIQGSGPVATARLSTTGNYTERFREDEDFWRSVERERVYRFADTNVLAITFEPPAPAGVYDTPLLDELFHGTAIASMLSRADPDVVILSVQSSSVAEANLPRGLMPPWLTKAFEWIAAQAWIDIVFVSKGGLANVDDASYDDLVRATRRIAESGKVLVGSAGNTAGPHWTDSWQGPPWVIAVGGVENSTRGSDVLASREPDVVATYTNLVAEHDSVDGYWWSSGTSYGSPLVAGTLSQALRMLRERNGWEEHDTRLGLARDAAGNAITGGRVREALNATAVYWNTTDFRPLDYPAPFAPDTTLVSVNAPVSPTPWVEMGWGFVGPELAGLLADGLDAGAFPAKPPVAVDYMAQVQAAREAHWAQRVQ